MGEQDYLHPRALFGFFPCYAQGNDIVVLDPRVADANSGLDTADPAAELTRFVCPRQPKGDRICLADFFRPAVVPTASLRRKGPRPRSST